MRFAIIALCLLPGLAAAEGIAPADLAATLEAANDLLADLVAQAKEAGATREDCLAASIEIFQLLEDTMPFGGAEENQAIAEATCALLN